MTVLAINLGFLPPAIDLDRADPRATLHVANQGRLAAVTHALST